MLDGNPLGAPGLVGTRTLLMLGNQHHRPADFSYVTAWLDKALRAWHSPLLAGESSQFPEVDFEP